MQSAAQPPAGTSVLYPVQGRPPSAPPRRQGHAGRNIGLGCLGLAVLVIVLALLGGHGSNPSGTASNNVLESPRLPSPSPISEAQYKASAKAIPYVQLEKDPAALAGTVVVYTGQVVQYDSATGTSNLRVDVTSIGSGLYTDTIWLDVDPAQTGKVFRDTIIRFWGEVVGPYTYTSVTGAQITIPEIDAKYVQVVS